MALAEHEPVPVGVMRSTRVDAQDAEVERGQDVDRRELPADVPQPGLVDHAQVTQPDARRTAAQLHDLVLGDDVHPSSHVRQWPGFLLDRGRSAGRAEQLVQHVRALSPFSS